ncbi:MAG TPA: fibronectin type III domain-containing protein, partial [Acidimicrobiales bacterium]
TYTFSVTATNATGTGAASAPSAALLIVGVPDAPALTGVTGVKNGVAAVWTAPTDGGSPVTAYTVTATPEFGSTVISTCTTTTGALSCTVGLSPGATYRLSVTATNAAGTGSASAEMAAAPGGGTVVFSGWGLNDYAIPPGANEVAVTAVGGGGGASNEGSGGAGGAVSSLIPTSDTTSGYFDVWVGEGGTGADGSGFDGGHGIFDIEGGQANSNDGYSSGAGGGDSGLVVETYTDGTNKNYIVMDAGGGGGGSTEDGSWGASGGPGQAGGTGENADTDGGTGGSGGTGPRGLAGDTSHGCTSGYGPGTGTDGSTGLGAGGGRGGASFVGSNAGGGGGAGCGGGGGGGDEGGGGAGGSYGPPGSSFGTGHNSTTGADGANGGSGSVTITSLVPAQDVAAQPGSSSVSVSWTQPATQPTTVTTVDYQVYEAVGSGPATAVPGATSSPVTVADLTPGTTYSFTVVATAPVSNVDPGLGGTLCTTSSAVTAVPYGNPPTTTGLESSANPSSVGQPVVYTATVSPTADGGTVSFTDAGQPITGCSTVALIANQA